MNSKCVSIMGEQLYLILELAVCHLVIGGLKSSSSVGLAAVA